MKILKPIETVSTDNLLNLFGSLISIAFCLGLFGGMSLVFFAITKDITKTNKDIYFAFDSISLLLILLFAERHMRKRIIPEIRKRCVRD